MNNQNHAHVTESTMYDRSNVALYASNPNALYVGTSIAGVDRVLWLDRVPERLVATYERRMQSRLMDDARRAAEKVVTVRSLGAGFLSYVPGHFMPEGGEEAITIGKTFIRGPAAMLAAIAAGADEATTYLPEQYADLGEHDTEAQFNFAVRGITRCLEAGAARIRKAL